MAGEFLSPLPGGSIQAYRQVLDRVTTAAGMDPKVTFRTATPGVLSLLVKQPGPWRGAGDERFRIPGVTQGGRAVGPQERMIGGTDDEGHIVAKRGFELAGYTQTITRDMFGYGAMTQERATELASKPILDFNDLTSGILADVITSGDYSGSQTDAFAWSATDLSSNTQAQPLITDTADEVENVYAYGTQTFTHWPLRNGTQAAAGHDHLFDTAAVWAADDAQTQMDNVLEHPGNSNPRALVGTTIAQAVIADMKTEYGAVESRVRLVQENAALAGANFMGGVPIGVHEGIEYWHVRDLPTSGALYYAGNKQPFHAHIGATGDMGMNLDRGAWVEEGDPERKGMSHGYGRYLSAGMDDPLAATYGEHAA